jgi:predicted DNA-binding transcriptional regulator AlpA
MSVPHDRLLDQREAAEFLSTSPDTLRAWRRDSFGPAFVRLGRSRVIRYRESDLQRFIEERVVEPGGAPTV